MREEDHATGHQDRSPVETLVLFDLDDCLYHAPAMPVAVCHNIKAYMTTHLDVPGDQVDDLCNHLYTTHGTTLAGLVNALDHHIDFDHWHEHVHYGKIDYEQHLKCDPFLVSLLKSMSPFARKLVFTNADRKHANICLDILGIADFFRDDGDIICFETLQDMAREAEAAGGALAAKLAAAGIPAGRGVLCKPNPLAFEVVLDRLGAEPQSTVFFDDSVRNVASAHELGIFSVLVRPGRVPDARCSMHIQHIHRVARELSWLTNGDHDAAGKEEEEGEQREIALAVRA